MAVEQSGRAAGELEAFWEAVNRSQAVIEFDPSGNVLWANDNFLRATGYRLDEIRGRHHCIFCDSAHAAAPEYGEFWARLGRG